MKVFVDVNLCSGAGLCENTCPEVFRLNNDGFSEVKTDPVPPAAEDKCRQAAESCPAGAISIEQ
ncbi:MAG: ferredoxin [Phycisphaerae bacterium]|nr:ferredoxin [Phycisphaerae bacterium]